MYSLLALLAVLSTLFMLRWLKEQPAAHAPCLRREQTNSLFYNVAHAVRLRPALAYILTVSAGLYTHYFFPAILPFHFLLLFLHYRRGQVAAFIRLIARWMLLVLVALLLYLPWLPIFIRQTGGRPVGASLADTLRFLPDAARWLALGPCPLPPAPCPLPLAPLLAAALLVVLGLAAGRRWPILLALGLIGLILFMITGGLTRPAFYKFLVIAVPLLWLLAAAGGRGRLRFLALPLLLVLWGHGAALAHLYFDPAYARADYRSMAARIEAQNHPDAGILLNAANQWEVFTYYYDGEAEVYPIPRDDPDPARIQAELETIAGRHERLYALFWGDAERDPQRLVERWLDSHAFKAADQWVGDVRFVTYAVPDEPAGVMETPLGLNLGDDITLEGVTLPQTVMAPGDIVQVTLFWQTGQPLEKRYKVFLHLLDPQGQIIGQRDSEPGGGLSLTTTWPPGEIIADNHGILVPLNTPPGAYRLLLGLYELGAPGQRLPISSDQGITDAYALAEITVVSPSEAPTP